MDEPCLRRVDRTDFFIFLFTTVFIIGVILVLVVVRLVVILILIIDMSVVRIGPNKPKQKSGAVTMMQANTVRAQNSQSLKNGSSLPFSLPLVSFSRVT